MRLLRTADLAFEDFIGKPPQYAILSHTWGDGEVSYQEMLSGNTSTKAGYRKIESCCKQAAKDGYQYVWIDTCCINKDSSAELSEAINSMFRWYRDAAVCYAYLADISESTYRLAEPSNLGYRVQNRREEVLKTSRWFKRGWTLQELIAPTQLIFFSSDWSILASKSDIDKVLSYITGIQRRVLLGKTPSNDCSIAQRMSWAAQRETSRPEDIAYW